MPKGTYHIRNYVGKIVIEDLLGMHHRICQSDDVDAAIKLSRYILDKAADLDIEVTDISSLISFSNVESCQTEEEGSNFE